MISSLNGNIREIQSDSLVLEINGVGYLVYVPAILRDHHQVGESVFLYTYMVVRQDSISLYGFETREGREYFTYLLSVDGIGPRLALAVLSTLSPDAIRRAVFHEQPEVFSRVPGVGRKTAQKILLQLQDKVKAEAGLEPVATGLAALSDVDTEVIDALTSLGYSIVEAQAALQSIPRDSPKDVETRLRLALQYFSS